MHLTDQDLREIGVSTFGARRRMILAIQGWFSNNLLLQLHCIDDLPESMPGLRIYEIFLRFVFCLLFKPVPIQNLDDTLP